MSCATLAPFGHGERTVIDKEVRDTWEIEPTRLVFGNPEWVKYVNGVVCSEVCKALGVPIGSSPPKMELYKLLLYETEFRSVLVLIDLFSLTYSFAAFCHTKSK